MVQHSRNLDWVRAVAGDLDHRRDRLFHVPRLLAGIQERAALRPSRDGMGGDVAGSLDASQPSLVHDTVLDGGRLGRPRQRRACAALAAVAADRGRSGWHGGDGDSAPRCTCHAGRRDCLLESAAAPGGVDRLCARVRPSARRPARILGWASRARCSVR